MCKRNAYLIMAHTDFEILKKTISVLDDKNADFYIHIDYKVKDFDLKEIVKLSKNYIISSVIMFIVCILIKNINAGKFATLVIQVITGGITYGICMLVLKDEFVREILKKINTKIKI